MASAPSIPKVTHGLIQRWAREGQRRQVDFAPISGYATSTRATVTAGTFTTASESGGNVSNVDLGRIWVVLNARMWADAACVLGLQYGQSAFSTAIQETVATLDGVPTGGGRVTWEFPEGLLLPEMSNLGFGFTPPTTSAPFTAGSAFIHSITADLNYDAQNVLMFIGDSITFAQNAGANDTTNMNGNNGFPMIVRNHLLSKKVDVRHINKGQSGMTGPNALVKINANSFYHCVEERERVRLIVEMMGMNDAATSPTSQSDFNAYLNGVLTLLDYYPNAELLAVSHPGTNDSAGGRVANSATIRGYKSAWVTSLANGAYASRVHFVDGTLAYGGSGGGSATPDGSINSALLADGTIHPGKTDHAAIVSNVLGPAIANTNWGKAVLGGTW